MAARERQPRHARERRGDGDEIVGGQLREEGRQLLAHAHAVLATHVIVVQKHDEQPIVSAGHLAPVLVEGEDLALRPRVVQPIVGLDQPEGRDGLELAALADFEVGGGEIAHRFAVLVEDRDVHRDGVHAASEHRLLSGILRGHRDGRRGDERQDHSPSSYRVHGRLHAAPRELSRTEISAAPE